MSQGGILKITDGSLPPDVPLQFVTNAGTAVPAANTLNLLGSGSITTSGSGSTVTFTSNETLNYTLVDDDASPYTVLPTDDYISCDVADATLTLLFPNAPTTYKTWIVKDLQGAASTYNISITTVGGSVTIDGQTTYLIGSNYGAVQLLFNGTSYEVF